MERKKNTGMIVICVLLVIVLAACAAAVIGREKGWINIPSSARITIDESNGIVLPSGYNDVSDEEIDSYIYELLSKDKYIEKTTDGTVDDGDIVGINYTVTRKDEPVESGNDFLLTIGSGQFLEDVEQFLIGKKTGTTVTADVQLPDEYPQNPDLAGKAVTYTIEILYTAREVIPEITDSWCKNYSDNYLSQEYATVSEFRQYVKDTIAYKKAASKIIEAAKSVTTVKSYDADQYAFLQKEAENILNEYSAETGEDINAVAVNLGYKDAQEYKDSYSRNILDIVMITDFLAKENDITVSESETDTAIDNYIRLHDLKAKYPSAEAFKEMGQAGIDIFTSLEVKLPKVIAALQQKSTNE